MSPRRRSLLTEKCVNLGQFQYRGGTRQVVAIADGDTLLLRASSCPDGQSVAFNLDLAGAERMGVLLCRFIELRKQKELEAEAK